MIICLSENGLLINPSCGYYYEAGHTLQLKEESIRVSLLKRKEFKEKYQKYYDSLNVNPGCYSCHKKTLYADTGSFSMYSLQYAAVQRIPLFKTLQSSAQSFTLL